MGGHVSITSAFSFRAHTHPSNASSRLANEGGCTAAGRRAWLVMTHGDCSLR